MNFIEKKSAREFEAGDVIFRERDEGSSMFIIQSGEVEVSAIKNNQKVVYAHLGKGAIFGEMALIDGFPRSATVTALRKTQCVEMSRMLFQKNMDALPPWMRSFFQIMVERLREANKKADTLTTRDNSRQVVLMVSNILASKEPNALGEIRIPWKPLVKDISLLLNLPYDQVDQVLNKMSITDMAQSEMSGEHGRMLVMKDFRQFQHFADYCKSRFLEKEGGEVPVQFKKIDQRENEVVQFLYLIMREQRWEPEIEQHLFEERFEQEHAGGVAAYERELKNLKARGIIGSRLDNVDSKVYVVEKEKLQTLVSMVDTLNDFEQMDGKL